MKLMLVILPLGIGLLAGPSHAQSANRAAHEVTVQRIGETRASGSLRIPLGSQQHMRESAKLEVASNLPLLKVVFSLMEHADPLPAAAEDVLSTDMRPIFTVQELVHPINSATVDLARALRDFPGDRSGNVDSKQRLIVTITE